MMVVAAVRDALPAILTMVVPAASAAWLESMRLHHRFPVRLQRQILLKWCTANWALVNVAEAARANAQMPAGKQHHLHGLGETNNARVFLVHSLPAASRFPLRLAATWTA